MDNKYTYPNIKAVKSEWTTVEGTDGYGTDFQKDSKAENKVDIGNEKQPEGTTGIREPLQERKAESPNARKNFTIGHDEELQAADRNAFGNGETTVDHLVKPGWND